MEERGGWREGERGMGRGGKGCEREREKGEGGKGSKEGGKEGGNNTIIT